MARFFRGDSASSTDEYSPMSLNDDDAVMIRRDDITNYKSENTLPQTPAMIQKIRRWLVPTQYDIAGGEYRKHLDSHAEGTGSWLTSSDSYQQWLQSDQHGFLWLKGIPGSGKSVHAAKTIQRLSEANPSCPVLYFFFRQIIAANHEPQVLVRDWMDQILEHSPPLQQRLAEYLKSGAKLSEVSSTTLLGDLKKAFLTLPGKVFCIVDALDEMDVGNEVFLEELTSLGIWRPRTVKVFVTSRPVSRVEHALGKSASLMLRLDQGLVDIDISTFVHTSLESSEVPRAKWEAITQAVPGKANGLFLYAKLAMDAFCQPGADINTVISELPADLNMLFANLIETHRHRSGVAEPNQLLILQAITHAVRPLRLIELANLIMVLDPSGQISTLSVAKSLVRKACGPLLEILPDETVSVVHHSFTEYLKGVTRPNDDTGYPILRQGLVHDRLARGCLQYLVGSGCLNDENPEVKGWKGRNYAQAELHMKFPFYKYAATNWHVHARTSETAEHPQNDCVLLLHGFFSHGTAIKSWLKMNWSWAHPRWVDDLYQPRDFTPLHVAAASGLVAYTQALLEERKMEVDTGDSSGRTALWWAALQGHASTTKVLIRAGANPDRSGGNRGLKPLHMAASANHYSVLKVLLDAGVDPMTGQDAEDQGGRCGNTRVSIGDTAMKSACCKGHLEAVEVLLSVVPDHEAQQALWWAVEERHPRLVRRIAQHPDVDVNHFYATATALYKACENHDLAIVEALLEVGADPQKSPPRCDSESNFDEPEDSDRFGFVRASFVRAGMTPLFGLGNAMFTGFSADVTPINAIFRRLVAAGADINHRSFSGETALHSAARGSLVMARLLLDAGVSPDVVDGSGCTPLHVCITPAMVSLLVEHGKAAVDMATWKGHTALGKALEVDEGPWSDKAERLLELGADPNLVSGIGRNVAGSGALNIVLNRHVPGLRTNLIKILLERGADPNKRTRDGRTSLLSRPARHERIQSLLLDAGADVNARNYEGETLFFKESIMKIHGSRSRHENLTRLIERGATVDVRDHKGRTCLHEVVSWCHRKEPSKNGFHGALDRMDFLIDLGIDAKAVDHAGDTLLHELSRQQGSVSMWKYLVYRLELDMAQVNNAGRTPLHTFCEAYEASYPHLLPTECAALDFVLEHSANIDVPDHTGVTALHLAVTKSEFLVRRLLQAGADPLAVNHDGMNTLHIAARSQKLNTIGLLLTYLKQHFAEAQHQADDKIHNQVFLNELDSADGAYRAVLPGVNATDNAMNSPLFYAVRSGRPETVRLLLEAGADPSKGPQACLGFEAEQSFMRTVKLQRPNLLRDHELKLDVEGRVMERHDPFQALEHHTARLEEILEMLVVHGADFTTWWYNHKDPRMGSLISNAVSHSKGDPRGLFFSGYTAFCLTQLSVVAEAEKAKNMLKLYGTRLTTIAHWFVPEEGSGDFPRPEDGGSNANLFERFMRNRQYLLVEELARRGAVFLSEKNPMFLSEKNPMWAGNLVTLIALGFTKLVKTIGAMVAEKALEEGKWHAFGDNSKPGLWYAKRKTDHMISLLEKNEFPDSLLMTAVRRKEPNLTMMELLIDEFKVNPNEASLGVYRDDKDPASKPQIHQHETPLHYLARGYRWWHVHQGLPYLLSLPGIDLNPKMDPTGRTPLHVAISNENGVVGGPADVYKYEAVRLLLENGADPNAVVKIGGQTHTCIALAKHSLEMTKMLLSHGAIVTPEGFMSVVRSLDTDVLQAILSAGVDPDSVFTPPEVPSAGNKGPPQGQDHQVALHITAGFLDPFRSRLNNQPQRRTVIRLLLAHGADPFLRYHVLNRPNRIDKYLGKADVRPAGPMPDEYREATAVHEVILCSDCTFLSVFLEHGVNLNVKDAYGLTILHATCLYGLAIFEPWSKVTKEANEVEVSHLVKKQDDDALTSEASDEDDGETVLEHLLAAGADIMTRDHCGRNVLMAMLSGKTGCTEASSRTIRIVVNEAPGLINQTDMNGKSVLMYAVKSDRQAKKGVPSHASVLIEAGASIHCKKKSGDGLLHILSRFMSTDAQALFRDLVAKGLDINERNASGETPLFNFARRTSEEEADQRRQQKKGGIEAGAIEMFRDLGADFTVKDNERRGLLHVAAALNFERFKELLAEGLNPLEEDNIGQTAIDKAVARGNMAILKLFEKGKAGKT